MIKQLVAAGLLASIAVLVAPAWAQEDLSAHQVVSDTTRDVMAVVAKVNESEQEDLECYYEQIQTVLDPVIDYRGFARSVMGPYASGERYRSLDESGREQLKAQLQRFAEVMRTGLVRTYGKGLLAFGSSRIEIAPEEAETQDQRRVSVQQMIYGDQAEPYVVSYQMGRSKSGEWKLRNVVIEGVNLGEIYRSQFQSAARKYEGDLDAVIDNWDAVEIEQQ